MTNYNNVNNLIKENSKLIYSIARRFSFCDIEDLYQVGALGIIKAYKNFDNSKNCKFSTYAYQYILGEMIEFSRKNRSVKTSRELIKLNKLISKAREFLTQKELREVSVSEICNFIGISEIDYDFANSINDLVYSFEFPVSNEGRKVFLSDFISNSIKQFDDVDFINLRDNIDKLEETDKKIIEMRYYKDYKQREVAEILNISQVQVSRKEKKILKYLNTKIS